MPKVRWASLGCLARAGWLCPVKFCGVFVLILLLITSCSPQQPASGTHQGETQLTQATHAPAGAQPNAAYSGIVDGIEQAQSVLLSLKIAPDGQSVTMVSLSLTEVTCEGFSAGTMMQSQKGDLPIVDNRLSGTVKGIGSLDLVFDKADSASGKVNLVLSLPFGGECTLGEGEWVGVVSETSQEPPSEPIPATEPPAPPPEPAQSEGSQEPTQPPSPQAGSETGLVPTELVVLPTQPPTQGPAPTQVPGMARTLEAPGGKEKIVNDQAIEKDGRWRVMGEIENISAQTLYSIQVTARLLNASGATLATENTRAAQNALRPGERAPFFVYFSDPIDAVAAYHLTVESKAAQAIPEERIRIIQEKVIGMPAHVIGLAEVIGEGSVEYPSVIAVFYDAAGNVVDLAQAFLPAPGAILMPGQPRPFSIYPGFALDFDHYRLLTDRGVQGEPQPGELEILAPPSMASPSLAKCSIQPPRRPYTSSFGRLFMMPRETSSRCFLRQSTGWTWRLARAPVSNFSVFPLSLTPTNYSQATTQIFSQPRKADPHLPFQRKKT